MSSIPDVYPLTYCIVAKRYNVSGNVILCGNSEPNVAGRMLFLTRGGELRHRFDPGANVEAMGGAGSNSNFVFFAAAIEEVNATQARLRMYAGRSAGAITREVVITKKILNGTIGIADSNGWDNTAVDSRLETSEFIVFESNAKTFSELDDVYARSVNRMAARGLTLI